MTQNAVPKFETYIIDIYNTNGAIETHEYRWRADADRAFNTFKGYAQVVYMTLCDRDDAELATYDATIARPYGPAL